MVQAKRNVRQAQRHAARARQTAATRRSIRKMGAVWGGESSKFPGFSAKAGK